MRGRNAYLHIMRHHFSSFDKNIVNLLAVERATGTTARLSTIDAFQRREFVVSVQFLIPVAVVQVTFAG